MRCVVLLLRCFYVAVLVAKAGPEPGVGSSTDGDVFVWEAAVETPAQGSDIDSLLPDDPSRHTRTQHGRAAVGLEPSVIHNEWERGMFPCSCACSLPDLSSNCASMCSCLVVRVHCSLVSVSHGVCYLVGLKSVPTGSPVVMSAAQCVMLARSAARAERTETQKETKTLAKREYFLNFVLFVLRVFFVSSIVSCLSNSCFSCVSVTCLSGRLHPHYCIYWLKMFCCRIRRAVSAAETERD